MVAKPYFENIWCKPMWKTSGLAQQQKYDWYQNSSTNMALFTDPYMNHSSQSQQH